MTADNQLLQDRKSSSAVPASGSLSIVSLITSLKFVARLCAGAPTDVERTHDPFRHTAPTKVMKRKPFAGPFEAAQ